jgi:hypothetical protein
VTGSWLPEETVVLRERTPCVIGYTDPFVRLSDPFPVLREHGTRFKVVTGAGSVRPRLRGRRCAPTVCR